jgi:hypothetical protein
VAKYWKFLIALCGAVAEAGALWADAPPWAVAVVGFATAALVFLKANEPAEPEAVTALRERLRG